MDSPLDELVRAGRRCERAAKQFDTEPVCGQVSRLTDACFKIGRAWSGSFLGDQSTIYMACFRPPGPGEQFDLMSDTYSHFNRSRGDWCQLRDEQVRKAIFNEAEVKDFGDIRGVAVGASDAFERAKEDILPCLEAMLAGNQDEYLGQVRTKIVELRQFFTGEEFAKPWWPRGSIPTSAFQAIAQGMRLPPHLQVRAELMEKCSFGHQAKELAAITRQVVKYIEQKQKLKGNTVAKTDGNIYLGHGRSADWRILQDFIQNRLKLPIEEFNRESAAGLTTKERLESMLDNSCFAFLVMTGEDEQADGSLHARSNVIHEIGLFQGRLGFEKAIVVLEEGCQEFSNIVGITQIRYPNGAVKAAFDEVRHALESAGIL